MEVKDTVNRSQGWLAGAAVFGIVGALMPRVAACPLGWAAVFLGLVPAAVLPRYPLPPRWEKTLRLVRCLWALEAMAISLGLCSQGMAIYTFPGWKAWAPALLILALGWRGSYLHPKGLERVGKLMVGLLGIMALALFLLTLPRLKWQRLAVRSWGDAWDAVQIFLLTAGAGAALIPARGKGPALATAGMGSAAAALTTGAEGTALAGMLAYPMLTLCDAAAFELRMSPFGSAMWALSEAALLILLLSWFPGGKGVAALACAVVFALTFTLPWQGHAVLIFLIAGAALGYLPVLWGMMHKHFTGESYI